MRFDLYFTDEEVKEFLLKKGYNIETINSWYSQNEYHGKVSFPDCTVDIAYLSDAPPTEEQLESGRSRLESDFGMEKIFRKEMYKALLKL